MRDHISKRHLSAISVTTIKYLFSQQMPEELMGGASVSSTHPAVCCGVAARGSAVQ